MFAKPWSVPDFCPRFSMAHAYLAALCAMRLLCQSKKDAAKPHAQVEAAEAACIPLTVPEIRKLLWHLAWRRVPSLIAVIAWSL